MSAKSRVAQLNPSRVESAEDQPRHTATSREIEEYLLYLRSPSRVMGVNFLAGIMRGLGAAVGATAIIGLLIWALAKAVNLPLVGLHFKDIQEELHQLVQEARFNDELERIEVLLQQIEENTRSNER